MLSLLAIAISAAAQTPDVVLTFQKTGNGTTAIAQKDFFTKVISEESANFVSSVTMSGVYPAGNASDAAFKIGSNSGSGTIKFVLAEDYQKEFTKIVITAKRFNAKGSPDVKINNVASASELPASGGDYGKMEFEFTQGAYSDISLTNGNSGGVLIESISIYFKDGGTTPPIESVAAPEITCVDNFVAITCTTEGAAITYTMDGGESIEYVEPFEITKTCTIEATASKEGMKPATASAVCKYKRIGGLEIDGVEYAEEIPVMWSFAKVEGSDAADNLNRVVTLNDGSAIGNWIAQCESSTYTGTNNGLQLGSKNDNYEGCKLVLTGSDIPAEALILSVKLVGRSASSGTSTWTLSVDGAEFGETIVINNTASTEYVFENVNLKGSELTFAASNVDKAIYVEGVTVEYVLPAEPEAPVMLDKPEIKHGTKVVWTVKYGKLHYRVEHAGAKSVMARGTDVTEDWTEATENGGKQFTYEYASGANHNVYVKNVVNGKEAYGEAFNINETGGLTGIESVSAEGAEGVRELYNLQGVRVSEAEAAAGVYIERRGGKVAKVVIR